MSTKRFTDADLAAILTKQGKPVDFKFRANPKPSKGPSESQLQQAVIKWWHHACSGFTIPEPMLMAFPLQAARSPRNGARMKAEGCRKGTLDMMLNVPRNGHPNLWIEMKTAKGVVSEEQEAMLHMLADQRSKVAVCRSAEEAIEVISDYLT